MTRKKRWPKQAEWARQDAIAEARAGIQEAEPALRGEVSEPAGLMRIIAAMVVRFYRIIEVLLQAKEGKDG